MSGEDYRPNRVRKNLANGRLRPETLGFRATCPICKKPIRARLYELDHKECRKAAKLVYSPSDKDKPPEQ